jgi:hypothetical protein
MHPDPTLFLSFSIRLGAGSLALGLWREMKRKALSNLRQGFFDGLLLEPIPLF